MDIYRYLTNERMEMIGALIGLAGAVFGSEHLITPETDRITVHGLTGDITVDDIEAARREKFRISPSCETCAHPCGRTNEYDLKLIENAESGVREGKYALLMLLVQIAGRGSHPFLYEGLRAIGEDHTRETLKFVLDHGQKANEG